MAQKPAVTAQPPVHVTVQMPDDPDPKKWAEDKLLVEAAKPGRSREVANAFIAKFTRGVIVASGDKKIDVDATREYIVDHTTLSFGSEYDDNLIVVDATTAMGMGVEVRYSPFSTNDPLNPRGRSKGGVSWKGVEFPFPAAIVPYAKQVGLSIPDEAMTAEQLEGKGIEEACKLSGPLGVAARQFKALERRDQDRYAEMVFRKPSEGQGGLEYRPS